MADPGLRDAAVHLVADAARRDPWLRSLRIAGIGIATVELERAASDLAAELSRAGLPEPAWSPGSRDPLLGATAWVSREWWPAWGPGGEPGDEPPALVLLEPDTEGRLAATLARFGEGVGAVYLARRERGPGLDLARLGTVATGPLGRARLVLARPSWGPHVLVLER